jgi:hypothetical protein
MGEFEPILSQKMTLRLDLPDSLVDIVKVLVVGAGGLKRKS